jgi:hypothetical protein
MKKTRSKKSLDTVPLNRWSAVPRSTPQAKLVEKFVTAVVDTGGKFVAGVVDTGGNFAAGVVDTGGKFATGVVDTGGAP